MKTVKTAPKKTVALTLAAAPFAIRGERGSDVAQREALLDASFGEDRHARTCQRIRDGRLPAEGLAFAALAEGKLVGTVRLWHVSAGGRAALVLGPLAVDPSCRALGVGGALMRHAIEAARQLGHSAIILLGDAPYYARFGFVAAKAAELHLPGPFERERLLGLELRDGALEGAWGMIMPTGALMAHARGLRAGRSKRLVTKAA
jgi:predicted N-acetyltransferase YhbS